MPADLRQSISKDPAFAVRHEETVEVLVPTKVAKPPATGSFQRLLFLHIPKCGGTFVQATFAPYSLECPTLTWKEASGHQTYRQYKSVFENRSEDIHDYLIMTVVRNPWAWHVSWYNYVREDRGGKRSGLRTEHKQFRKMTFADYLDWLEDDNVKQSPQGYLKMLQSDWICDENGVPKVDYILRQERLLKDVSSVIDRLGLAIEPAPIDVNVSTRDDYRRYYTSDGIDRIAKRHRRDIELFDYVFE